MTIVKIAKLTFTYQKHTLIYRAFISLSQIICFFLIVRRTSVHKKLLVFRNIRENEYCNKSLIISSRFTSRLIKLLIFRILINKSKIFTLF